ncbi:nucleotide sugar dehydrogenase [Nocardiopsis ansamitocini]|uniref:UDP-N-acetyl-D-mannosaminuronic acid dehydrogenase n=1 Tax=Nocardiopsis ansamitocini TaxID=1670832 RepID=A0A9W6UKS3_9ACTN|nr:nucleotide sugar dehydrogenase [Nocardiopsis ansamitocini]GLU50027.1 UDP-N-acetyl-D-mannosaminuronic acid dehydrogenase [Nocardiopsis ansamitocini]
MRFLPDREDTTTAVIGLGYVGSCLAATLADTGMNVVGVDTDPLLVEELEVGTCRFKDPGLPELLAQGVSAGRLRVTTDYQAVSSADVVIVAVGTPIREQGLLMDAQLRSACAQLGPHIRPGQLVIVKSTVPPGTMRELVVPLLEAGGLTCGTDFGLAFCPERLSQGAALSELRNLPIVVGGWCTASTEAAAQFWRRTIGVTPVPCSSMETAEVVKLANNWWVDHNIALANELAQFCSAMGVDAIEVIKATNAVPKGAGSVNVLLPGVGVGGSCLTKDPWMVWRAARDKGVELQTIATARAVNDSMPAYTAGLIVDELEKLGKRPEESRVAVIGLAFKNNTGDVRSTPTAPVVAELIEAGADVALFDTLVDPADAKTIFGVGLASSVEEAVEGADCLAVLAWHREFEDLDLNALRGHAAERCVIVDGRAHFSAERVEALRASGFVYRGIGR